MSDLVLRVGSRASVMATAQVARLRAELAEVAPHVTMEFVPVTTTGDTWSGPLSALGGKGAFTREIDEQLLGGVFDVSLQCLKDIPGDVLTPAGIVTAAYLQRDDPGDALVHPGGLHLEQLPEGTRIGTSSPRRSAQILACWPHLRPVAIRGNADTRLAKLDAGHVEALILAIAGLHRIEAADRITEIIGTEAMVPSVGAGILVLQCRHDDPFARQIAALLADEITWREATAERTMLYRLQGHCHSPIAGHCQSTPGGQLSLHGRVISNDGTSLLELTETGTDPIAVGEAAAAGLIQLGAASIIGTPPQPAAPI